MALYRVSQAHGRTVEQTGELAYEIGRAFVGTSPAFLLRLFTPMNFTRRAWEHPRQRADESHRREYREDYGYGFVEGDGRTCDYGMDYLECASCRFLVKQVAPELAPYLCRVDMLYSYHLTRR